MNLTRPQPKAVIICGPTGIGKTGFAMALAQTFGGEIVGADSMQIYRHMNIGTAKPSHDEQRMVRHHMVDVIDPDETFDAQTYADMAFAHVSNLAGRGVVPFVVGGTGLYIRSLVFGLFGGDPSDPLIRNRLTNEAKTQGHQRMYQRLALCDPDTAKKLHANDTYRIIRALEVYERTGTPLSAHHRRHRFRERRLNTLSLGLMMDRDVLYQRIDARVDAMIDAGLLEEVRRLLDAGYSQELKSMQSLGYRHMVDFVHDRMDWAETVRTMKRDTRRYAKRQLTWFRADPEIIWLTPEEIDKAESAVGRFLEKMK